MKCWFLLEIGARWLPIKLEKYGLKIQVLTDCQNRDMLNAKVYREKIIEEKKGETLTIMVRQFMKQRGRSLAASGLVLQNFSS